MLFRSDGHLLEEAPDLSTHIYSDLFTAGPRTGVALAPDFWPLGARVSSDENGILLQPFQPEEIRREIMDMKANSAPGPDGLPVAFSINSVIV